MKKEGIYGDLQIDSGTKTGEEQVKTSLNLSIPFVYLIQISKPKIMKNR